VGIQRFRFGLKWSMYPGAVQKEMLSALARQSPALYN